MAAASSIIAGGAAIAAPVIGGLMGAEEGRKNRDAANRAREAALAQFTGLEVPEIAAFTPEELQYIGDYDPRLEEALALQDSAMEQVAVDPRLQAQQMQALEQIAAMTGEGMTPAEEAALMKVRRGAAAEAQAKQGQILQEMQARGQGGSGAELIARLKASQAAADRQGAMGLDVAQAAQQRALQAMSQQGQLAGQIRGQEFGEQERLAAARDAVNRFNLQNQQSVAQRNVAAQNQAALRNLQQQQQIAGANVAQRNQAAQYNRQLQQQRYQNQLGLAQGRAGAYGGQASDALQHGAQQAGMMAGIGSGIGQGAGAIFGSLTKKG